MSELKNEKTDGAFCLNAQMKLQKRFEAELSEKGSQLVFPGAPMTFSSLFLLGCVNKLQSNSKGFRALINERIFSSAAALLRMQIDIALRVNGMKLLKNVEDEMRALYFREKRFRDIVGTNGKKLFDKVLLDELAKDYEWMATVYEHTSDHIHLSFASLHASTASTDDTNRTVTFVLSGDQGHRNEDDWEEITKAFLHVSSIAGTLTLGALSAQLGKPATDQDA